MTPAVTINIVKSIFVLHLVLLFCLQGMLVYYMGNRRVFLRRKYRYIVNDKMCPGRRSIRTLAIFD